jgi:uncharacterized membrane protein
MGSDQLIRRFVHFGPRGILILSLKGVYLLLQLLYLGYQCLSTLLQSLLDYRSEFVGIHFM